MNSKTIQKYKGRSIGWLKNKAAYWFNRWIRLRDRGKPCISCPSYNTSDASHFYSAGHYSSLAFNEDNVHLSCAKCNRFLHGNLNEYRLRLEKKIGSHRLEQLDVKARYYKRTKFKWDRVGLIEIIETYKEKCKQFS